MFGISLSEVALIAVVALIVVGPQKLPGMLRTLGDWVRKIRHMTTQVRAQTGIDDILRQEGIDGGIAELRSLIRGDLASLTRARTHLPEATPADDPYESAVELDRYREYPPEGADAGGALADDLWDEPAADAPTATLDAPSHVAEVAAADQLGAAPGEPAEATETAPAPATDRKPE